MSEEYKAICQKLNDIQRRLTNIESKVEPVSVYGERIEYAKEDINALGNKIRSMHTPETCPNRRFFQWIWVPAVTLAVALLANSYVLMKMVIV